jgi:hypothetical protein
MHPKPVLATWLLLSCQQTMAAAPDRAAPEIAPAPLNADKDNDGTDPTRPTSQIKLSYDRQDLRDGYATDFVSLEYNRPLGDGSWVIRPKLQLGALHGPGVDSGLGIGDASVKLTKIVERNARYGVVASFELVAPTGSSQLSGGKWLAKPNLVYAMFLKGGHIFAPAIVQFISIGGDSSRPPVNLTTLDFYIVPRLANKKLFMTIDPAVNIDWQNDRQFGALAVTLGYKLGPMLGGRGQISAKPAVGIGPDAPFGWGLQVAFQLLGL